MAVRKINKTEVGRLQPGQWVWDSAVKGFGIRRQTTDAVFYLLRYRTIGRDSTECDAARRSIIHPSPITKISNDVLMIAGVIDHEFTTTTPTS